jgi:conjugative transfer region lipoprotein (TIGR03751 family)
MQVHCLTILKSLTNFFKNYLSIFLIFSLTIIFLITQLAGCATAGKGALPQGGDMTMAQIYQKETGLSMNNDCNAGNQDINQVRQKLHTNGIGYAKHVNYTAYSVSPDNFYKKNKKSKKCKKNKKNSTKQLFKPLDNPEIPMYIYPHLVQTNSGAQPVPGYTTAFFLYRENHFALPSEDY